MGGGGGHVGREETGRSSEAPKALITPQSQYNNEQFAQKKAAFMQKKGAWCNNDRDEREAKQTFGKCVELMFAAFIPVDEENQQ